MHACLSQGRTCRVQFVKSKTRTYFGRVGTGQRSAGLGGDGRDGTPTGRVAQEITVHPTPQTTEENSPWHFLEARTKEAMLKPLKNNLSNPKPEHTRGAFAQETTVPRTLQGIEETCLERLFRGTNKRNALYLSNPKPGRNSSERRNVGLQGGVGPGRTGRRRVGPPRTQPSPLHPRTSKTIVPNVSSEALNKGNPM